MSEHDSQVALFNFLALYEHLHPAIPWIFAVPNGGFRHKPVAEEMKAEGVKAGVWDIFVPFPAEGFEGMWIEMKWKNGHLSKEQKAFKAYMLKYCNYKFMEFHEWLEAVDAIFKYLEVESPIAERFG